jgi:hypothetical protein
MNQKHFARTSRAHIVLAVLVASMLTTTAFAQAPVDTAFESAQALYDKGDYTQAYGRFAELADAGHAEASRIAWLMNRHGRRLYGRAFEATPYQQLSWQWRQSCGFDCGDRQQPPRLTASGC